MSYLLDTHIFLWWVLNHPNLSRLIRAAIADPTHDVYVSAASAWEMMIKSSIGKLTLPSSPERWIKEQLRLNAFLPLPISIEHALAVASLPPLHKDPFDRIIIAQANVEGLTLITDDAIIPQYAVKVL